VHSMGSRSVAGVHEWCACGATTSRPSSLTVHEGALPLMRQFAAGLAEFWLLTRSDQWTLTQTRCRRAPHRHKRACELRQRRVQDSRTSAHFGIPPSLELRVWHTLEWNCLGLSRKFWRSCSIAFSARSTTQCGLAGIRPLTVDESSDPDMNDIVVVVDNDRTGAFWGCRGLKHLTITSTVDSTFTKIEGALPQP
jgi:hypothetical protein